MDCKNNFPYDRLQVRWNTRTAVLQFRTREKRYASQVYSCNRLLIGLSYYAGCILLLKCNFIDCERSININFCFMRKIIPLRGSATHPRSFFSFFFAPSAQRKRKHTNTLAGLSAVRCICIYTFSKRTKHSIFTFLRRNNDSR